MRVVGEELAGFDRFIRPIPYPVEGFESISEVEKKELRLWEDPGAFRSKPMPARFTPGYFANQVKRLFHIPNPEYIDHDYYRKYYVDHLEKNINVKHGKFLVVPQHKHAVILANALHRKFNIAYASWMMDDHLLQYDKYQDAYHYPYPLDYEPEFRYHLQHARHVFTISENMGEFYKGRFGISYSVLFSPADPVEESVVLKSRGNGNLRFCHFGRIWRWSVDAVQRFAAQLEALDATLDVYSHLPAEGALRDNRRVTIKEPVGPDEVAQRMREYDAVTIFYGFDDDVRHWSAFNISTKMSECLASGLPVLFVGPEYAAMTQWARSQACGVVVTDTDDERQLAEVRLLQEPAYRAKVAEKCLQVSREKISAEAMKRVWKEGWNKVLID